MGGLDEETRRQKLSWLVDVPLFIDERRVDQLYDITVEPVFEEHREELTEREDKDESEESKKVTGAVEGGIKSNSLLNFIGGVNLSANLSGSQTSSHLQGESARYEIIDTPQRQLAQIVIQYLLSEESEDGSGVTDRNFKIIHELPGFDWNEIDRDITSPRTLVVLQLPGASEIYEDEPDFDTRLVPTAAEFEDGSVLPIYSELESDHEKPPKYPKRDMSWEELGKFYEETDFDGYCPGEEIGDSVDTVREKYWEWFHDNFDPKATTQTVEEIAKGNGRIEWIDFRLPVNRSGQTLHLHIQGRGEYSTGTFAYNFIKRGYKHGLTIVGTLKSEPDLDVLAIYER